MRKCHRIDWPGTFIVLYNPLSYTQLTSIYDISLSILNHVLYINIVTLSSLHNLSKITRILSNQNILSNMKSVWNCISFFLSNLQTALTSGEWIRASWRHWIAYNRCGVTSCIPGRTGKRVVSSWMSSWWSPSCSTVVSTVITCHSSSRVCSYVLPTAWRPSQSLRSWRYLHWTEHVQINTS